MSEVKKEFNPQAVYGWTPEQEFVFNGQDFNVLFNITKNYVSGDVDAAKSVAVVSSISDCFKILRNKLVEMVESGAVQEMQQDSQEEVSPTQEG